MRKHAGIFLLVWTLLPGQAEAATTRLKDLTSIEGVRDNQLIGYGLVVGLAGTGDRLQTIFSAQSLTNLLQRMGVTVPPTSLRVNNTAAVMVTATLPPFAQTGTRIDVTVAAMGDASNLQGGLLLLTSLRGPDGQVYGVAQGPVVTGGFVAGRTQANQTVNHPTVGRVPNGAIVEHTAPSVGPQDAVRLQLRRADFTTAARIVTALNKRFHEAENVAKAESSGLVAVQIPKSFEGRPVEFVAELESVAIEVDLPARVVINERTGTIIMGKDVRIAPVAVMHGNLSVEIVTNFGVSQPAPFSDGQTVVVPETSVGVKEEKARNVLLKEGATVEELVKSLSAIGSSPRDVIAILQTMRAAGALSADLEVI